MVQRHGACGAPAQFADVHAGCIHRVLRLGVARMYLQRRVWRPLLEKVRCREVLLEAPPAASERQPRARGEYGTGRSATHPTSAVPGQPRCIRLRTTQMLYMQPKRLDGAMRWQTAPRSVPQRQTLAPVWRPAARLNGGGFRGLHAWGHAGSARSTRRAPYSPQVCSAHGVHRAGARLEPPRRGARLHAVCPHVHGVNLRVLLPEHRGPICGGGALEAAAACWGRLRPADNALLHFQTLPGSRRPMRDTAAPLESIILWVCTAASSAATQARDPSTRPQTGVVQF